MGACITSLLVLLAILHGQSHALKCYICTDSEVKSGGNPIVNKVLNNRDPNCEFNPSKTETHECGSGFSCLFFSGKVTKKLNDGTTVSTRVVERKCQLGAGLKGCSGSDDTKWNYDVENAIVEKERVCFCSTDHCDASNCAGGFWVKNTCVRWWYLAVGGVGMVLVAVGGVLVKRYANNFVQ